MANGAPLSEQVAEGAEVQDNLIVGIPLGCLIALITGMITLLILKDAFPPRFRNISFVERIFGRKQASGIGLAVKISALPIFWFGGPWLTTIVMSDLNWKELRGPYLVTLAAVYLSIIIVPLVCLIAIVLLVCLIANVSRRIR